ncbi:IucA/IucC family protein [Nocardioides antri]|uniref:IucA/IucC family protein n=1 Tax=Nocardioides antri TaxID=2607659 RepID=A0A5B1M8I6_9ACTN|nr:IucA/IucC family protein [Nocardioides antri]KAA1428207.1 IucA/IucC family protein [Nocardioides antri]
MSSTLSAEPRSATPGATAEVWARAGARLVARAIAELAHEQLVVPEADTGAGGYRLSLGAADYAFRAERDGFSAWHVDAASVRRDGAPATDLARFFLDARVAAGLDAVSLAEVVREATATQAAEAHVLAGARTADELLGLGYAELEQHLGGHPVIVLNKGRIGLDAIDLEHFAPEAHGTITLVWYAAHPDLATYSALPGLDASSLLAEELGAAERAAFDAALATAEPDADRYVWFPVHPYQDATVVRTLFAGELATGRLIRLGHGTTAHRPVQSVRSLVAPGRRDVKMSLLMRNTLVWRGLGAEATRAAPAASRWLGELYAGDPELQATGIGFLREVASVVVRHPHFADLPDAPYRYTELLGAVWRDPVEQHLTAGESARSLATLLHVDRDGRALVAELVARSGLDVEGWLRQLFRALFPGLLLCLTRHGVAFCPHGENTILVFRENVPARILVKDFAEDITLLPGRDYRGLPPEADRVLVRWPLAEMAHSIISAILTGHFRYLAPLLREHTGLLENRFWSLVREALLEWRAAHPDLADAFDELGLLAPTFERIALNREQLTGGGFHDRAERDAEPDLTYGHIPNPLHVAGEPA